MKTLKFESRLVPLILSGEKKSTFRLFDDKNLQVDDKLSFVNKDTGVEFVQAIIVSVREKALGDFQDSDFEGHEKYSSQTEILGVFRRYYGERVTLDAPVQIVDFRLTLP